MSQSPPDSRIYPSDVLGGCVIGGLAQVASIAVLMSVPRLPERVLDILFYAAILGVPVVTVYVLAHWARGAYWGLRLTVAVVWFTLMGIFMLFVFLAGGL